MKLNKTILLFLLAFISLPKISMAQKQKPNVLWILTDDQRYDAIRAFNKMLTGKEMSELGYVESPNVDRLTEMGTTFVNTYCQATGCAPSRASMHYGRYPFRSGVYEFEYHNNNASHFKPTLPEQMAALGYQTLHIGKLGVRLKTKENGKLNSAKIYDQDISFKQLRMDGFTDWGKDWFREFEGQKLKKPLKNVEFFVTDDGKFEYKSKELEEMFPKYKGSAKRIMEKYDLLMHYNKKKGPQTPFSSGIIAGVSSRKAGETRDGYYTKFFKQYLENENKKFDAGSRKFKGVNPSKPLFCHIGFDFPHTPVLPPASYRDRFKKHTYKVPSFDKKELKNMPSQLKKLVTVDASDHFTDEEKQKMIQDYYAFCAYGDALVGEAVDDFIAYSKEKNQPWMIVYVCGDHGWKLNEHGAISKFSSWAIDSHNPIVVVSSDKKAFPAGKVVKDFTEFVDIAPTIMAAGGADLKKSEYDYLDGFDMQKVASKQAIKRDYIVGESHAVTGPRAYIRTKEYVFSMQTRPTKKRGENMEWARNTDYKDLAPALYDMKKDPNEINNLAFDKKYAKIVKQMKEKLINIVLGDNRVEVNWGKRGDGTQVFHSNFAPGAHDYKLTVKK
ncbi:sulfatase-like hydrolase/transferase [Wenyingzhuangia sp. 2_MG-2023]|uniref:sulfatase-like hydrolase/transferase n=1 Tax=Wenyingzhuangia sp. 2_MG-2023 TaxID=3062639 RepID=UPI0026E3279B|nr:sulfatase-like hydrolase/transferase [Wenyingzhuangia sp. 2_MG-2023]MDO6738827.1 sulfatase-like hydrolase/transferase [Wenyingzhuangia sp. 2_MG-2023]